MTLEEITPWLFSRVTGGIRWGLERTEELLAGVGDPHRRFRSILIGGTNGKGSVAAFTESALREAGARRVGLYTSPHLVHFGERFRVDGQPLADEVLAKAATRLRPAIERTGASFFEATTAIAFLAFADAGVEVAVVEVGLGGRLDATNVLEPMATAVTNVALDHAEYLGESLDGIAFEKAGIFKRGVPALAGVEEGELRDVLRARAAEVGAPLRFLDEVATIDDVRTGTEGTSFHLRSAHWGERRVAVGLPGYHQARNAALAAELLAMLPGDVTPPWPAVAAGLARARWPGRLQVVRRGAVTWTFDVAHNAAGAEALVGSLPALGLDRPRIFVVGILADKQWREMLGMLGGVADELILTVPPSAPAARRWDPAEAADWCAETLRRSPRVVPDLTAALQQAERLAGRGTVVVTGSVHTVGDAMDVLGMSGSGG